MEFQNICNEMVAPFLLRHPKGTALAACSTPCRLQAGHSDGQDAGMSDSHDETVHPSYRFRTS